MLFVPCLMAVIRPDLTNASQVKRAWELGFKLYLFALILLVGFRYQVGADWHHYLAPIELALEQKFFDFVFMPGDLAYSTLTWLSAHAGFGVYGVNLICAGIFALGLAVFCQNSLHPWLALAVAVPYLVIVVAMGYTRQGVAIGLVMLGLVSLDKNNLPMFIAWMVMAALFHKTALILIPLGIFAGRKSWVSIGGILLIAVLLFFLLLAEYVDHLVLGYIADQYASSGAAIRIAMNAVPAAIFLVFRKRFKLSDEQRMFWTWISFGGLLFIGLLAISPSSTAVDRVALYWIPLQLYVLSRLPTAMAHTLSARLPWVALVLLYSLIVQFVWLFYADHRFAWVPYQFYPWVWLWQ